jgi:Spy/CpxP family protein refolding chaperone
MKPTLRDYLTIAAALLAILLCGYGVGFLVGERTTRSRLAPPPGGADERQNDWESATLERLCAELDLTPEQRERVRGEIGKSARNIARTRARAVQEYRKELLDLHRRIEPGLTEKQRLQMEESRRRLENSLDKSG